MAWRMLRALSMKRAQTTSIVLLTLLTLGFTLRDAAAAELRTGERVYIAADTVLDEDLYAAAREVVIDGAVRGDVIAAGSKITIHGRVEGSVMAAGGSVIVDGKVGRAARLGGGEVRVDGEVGGDALAVCGTCTVGNTGKVGVDLLAAGGDLSLAGTVLRRLRAAGGTVRLAGVTQQDAQVRAGKLSVDSSAAAQSLTYGTQEPASIAAGARIGRVENRPDWAPAKPNRAAGSLLGVLMALLSGAGLLFLLRARATDASQLLEQRPGASLLSGLLVAIAAPLLIALGMVTVVAIPLSLLAAAVYLSAMYLGYLSSAHLLGDLMLRKLRRQVSPFAAFALGIAALWLASLLPVLGPLVRAVATLAGLGSLWQLLAGSRWFTARFRGARALPVSSPMVSG